MIVVVAGLPAAHFNRIQQRAPTIFGAGHIFISSPLRPGADGIYTPNTDHGDALIATLTKRVEMEPKIREHGCGVLVLATPGINTDAIVDQMAPFSIVRVAELPLSVKTLGRQGEMSANQIADTLRRAAAPLIRAVNAMSTELKARLNRTPLLLPLRNFDGPIVSATILELSRSLSLEEKPSAAIENACNAIEAVYPFAKVKGEATRCFMDDRKIQFRLPARAHHGIAVTSSAPHNPSCYLNGGFRLGGCYDPGFHYDCRNPRTSGKRKHARPLTGTFFDCHGDNGRYKGKPHLNIAPNDFVRA